MKFKEELDLALEAIPKDAILRRARRRRKRNKAVDNITKQVTSAVQDKQEDQPEYTKGNVIKVGEKRREMYQDLKNSIEVSIGNIVKIVPELKQKAMEAMEILFRGVTSYIGE